MRTDELQDRIRDAWGDSSIPDATAIVHDRSTDFDDCFGIFANRVWQDIDFQTIMHGRSCITFFTADAVRYFLPAFLLASIHEILHVQFGWDVTEYTLDAARRSVIASEGDKTSLSRHQFEVIESYLDWLGGHADTPETKSDVAACVTYLREKGFRAN